MSRDMAAAAHALKTYDDSEEETLCSDVDEVDDDIPSPRVSCSIICSLILLMAIFAVALIYAGSGNIKFTFEALDIHGKIPNGTIPNGTFDMLANGRIPDATTIDANTVALAAGIGMEGYEKMKASILVLIAFCAVVGSATTSALVATCSPHGSVHRRALMPKDFRTHGTLSNVSQDITKPHGRIFTVALFTASMLMLVSMYTFWIYRPWIPLWNKAMNPVKKNVFTYRNERRWRLVWASVPYVGFMFTAACPSLSTPEGYEIALTAIHNIAAPLSMAFVVVMETIQLNYGEEAFANFWDTYPPGYLYGGITNYQRLRCILVIYAWIAAVIFLSLQIYFGVGMIFGIKVKTNYCLALISFYGEVFGMILAFLLPAVEAIETLHWEDIMKPIMFQAVAGQKFIHVEL